MKNFWQLAAPVAFIWLGMVCAISFMEAWLKFQAPGVSLEIGLGIGRVIFGALNRMEVIFGLIILLAFLRNRQFDTWMSYWFYIILTVLAIQTFWLLPALDIRAGKIIAGEALPKSYLHLSYILLDLVKAFSLLVFGVKNLTHQYGREPHSTD